MNKTITIKFTYNGKKYTKKAYLRRLPAGAMVENTKKNCEDFCVNDIDDEWSISFYDGKYIFEIMFEINTDVDVDEYYTFNPIRLIVWEEGVDAILDDIEIESLKVAATP